MSSIFVANNIILLAELIGQGSIGRAIGQADSEVLERPLLDHKANYFKRYTLILNRSLHENQFRQTYEKVILTNGNFIFLSGKKSVCQVKIFIYSPVVW